MLLLKLLGPYSSFARIDFTVEVNLVPFVENQYINLGYQMLLLRSNEKNEILMTVVPFVNIGLRHNII